jgi:hypothetical protein
MTAATPLLVHPALTPAPITLTPKALNSPAQGFRRRRIPWVESHKNPSTLKGLHVANTGHANVATLAPRWIGLAAGMMVAATVGLGIVLTAYRHQKAIQEIGGTGAADEFALAVNVERWSGLLRRPPPEGDARPAIQTACRKSRPVPRPARPRLCHVRSGDSRAPVVQPAGVAATLGA